MLRAPFSRTTSGLTEIVFSGADTPVFDSDSSGSSSEDDTPALVLTENAWKKRLELLGTLKLRERADGYEQPESIEERRTCMRTRTAFLHKLEKELDRRERRPTDRDQAENALLAIIDRICETDRNEQRKRDGKVSDRSWHTASNGHFLTLLKKAGATSEIHPDDDFLSKPDDRYDEDSKSSNVTDLPFVDMIISHSAMMLPLIPITPPPWPRVEGDDLLPPAHTGMKGAMVTLLTGQKSLVLQGVSGLLRRAGYKAKSKNSDSSTGDMSKKEGTVASKKEGTAGDRSRKEGTVGTGGENSMKNAEEVEPLPLPVPRITGRVNQIRGTGMLYEDSVTVTVTALLDPPPHYILRSPQTMPDHIGLTSLAGAYNPLNPHPSIPLPTAVSISRNPPVEQVDCLGSVGIDKSSVWVGPMVGTGGRPGHYSHFCRTKSRKASTTPVIPAPKAHKEGREGKEGEEGEEGGTGGKGKEKPAHIFDKSQREAFEKQFRGEIAMACCLPAKNITIEEIRHLDQRDQRLLDLLNEHTTTQTTLIKEKEEEVIRVVNERKLRRSINENPEKFQLNEMRRRLSAGKTPANTPGMLPGMVPGVTPETFPGMTQAMFPGMHPELLAGMHQGFLPGSSSESAGYGTPGILVVPMTGIRPVIRTGTDTDSVTGPRITFHLPGDSSAEALIVPQVEDDYLSDSESNNSSRPPSSKSTGRVKYTLDDAISRGSSFHSHIDSAVSDALMRLGTPRTPIQIESPPPEVKSPSKSPQKSPPKGLKGSTQKKDDLQRAHSEAVEREARLLRIVQKGKNFLPSDRQPTGIAVPFVALTAAASGVVAEIKYQVQDVAENFMDGVRSAADWGLVAAGYTGLAQVSESGQILRAVAVKEVGGGGGGGERNEGGVENGVAVAVTGCLEPLVLLLNREKTVAPDVPIDWKKEGVSGCEITFALSVSDLQRLELGVPNWQASDVPILLARQMLELDSPLMAGGYTRHIVDIRFKTTHTRRAFKQWEDFWVHSLHPVYFGRSALSIDKKFSYKSHNAQNAQNSRSSRGSPLPSRLPVSSYQQSETGVENKKNGSSPHLINLLQGMNYKDPSRTYSLRSIRAFLALPSIMPELLRSDKASLDKWALVGLHPPAARNKLLIDDYKDILSTSDVAADIISTGILVATGVNSRKSSLMDVQERKGSDMNMGRRGSIDNALNEELEEYIDDDQKLEDRGLKATPKPIKFQMSNVTPALVDHLYLQYLAAEANLEVLMKKGLVDGVRLRVEQLTGMKMRDAAKRVYHSARSMFKHKQRQDEVLPIGSAQEPMHLTEVKTEKFDRWVREVKREELQRLKVRQKAFIMMKSLRRQEAGMKLVFGSLRLWLIETMIASYPYSEPNPAELLRRLNLEVHQRKANSVVVKVTPGISAATLAAERQKQIILQDMEALSETKRTKELLRAILKWVKRVKKQCKPKSSATEKSERMLRSERTFNIGLLLLNDESDEAVEHTARSGHLNHIKKRLAASGESTARSNKGSSRNSARRSISKLKYKDTTKMGKHTANTMMKYMADRGKGSDELASSDAFLRRAGREKQLECFTPSYLSRDSSARGFSFSRQPSLTSMMRSSKLDIESDEIDLKSSRSSIDSDDNDTDVDVDWEEQEQEEDEAGVIVSIKKMYLMAFIETYRLSLANTAYNLTVTRRKASLKRSSDEEIQKKAWLLSNGGEIIIKSVATLNEEKDLITLRRESSSLVNSRRESSKIFSIPSIEGGMRSRGSSISSFRKQSKMNLKMSRSISKAYESYDDDVNRPTPVPKELALTPEELQYAGQVFWFSQVLASSELLNCLAVMPSGASDSNLPPHPPPNPSAPHTPHIPHIPLKIKPIPTGPSHAIKRQELLQFASIVMEVEPAWRSLLLKLNEDRERVKVVKDAARKKEAEYEAYVHSLNVPSQDTLTREEALEIIEKEEDESVTRITNQLKKEEAFVTSHTHTYVVPPREKGLLIGEERAIRAEPFCTICRKRKYVARINALLKAEDASLRHHENSMARRLLVMEESVRKLLCTGISLEDCYPLPPRLHPKTLEAGILKLSLGKVHPTLLMSGLSLFRPNDGEPLTILDNCYAAPVTIKEESEKSMSIAAASSMSDLTAPSVLIRVWYLEENGEKGELVGCLFLDSKILTNPTRGTRTYPLVQMSPKGDIGEQTDHLVGLQSSLRERGIKDRTLGPLVPAAKASVSLRLFATKNDKDGQPRTWHLEIIRAHGFPRSIHAIEGAEESSKRTKFPDSSPVNSDPTSPVKIRRRPLDPLTNVIIEVLWRGQAEMKINTQIVNTDKSRKLSSVKEEGKENTGENDENDDNDENDREDDDGDDGIDESPVLAEYVESDLDKRDTLRIENDKEIEAGEVTRKIAGGVTGEVAGKGLEGEGIGGQGRGGEEIGGEVEGVVVIPINNIDESSLVGGFSVSVMSTKTSTKIKTPQKGGGRKSRVVKSVVINTWMSVGCTTKKEILSTIGDHRFGEKIDGNTSASFDFPPTWICRGKGGERGLATTEKQLFESPGEWVPRNYASRPIPTTQSVGVRRSPISLRTIALAVYQILAIQRAVRKRPGMSEARKRLDVWKLLGDAEETERRLMAVEEINRRTHFMTEEEQKYRVSADQQVLVAKQFNQLMTLIQCPTKILSRLRFYMGSSLDGGGMRVTCQDPAVPLGALRSILEVYVVPLMYPEDEAEVRRHVEGITSVNRSYPVVTPIVELSVHNLRGYTAMGFTSADTRTAVLLVEVNEDKPSLCEYLRGRKTVSDKEFVAVLYQVLEGLAGAHEEGIIHRNLHADSVFISKKPSIPLKTSGYPNSSPDSPKSPNYISPKSLKPSSSSLSLSSSSSSYFPPSSLVQVTAATAHTPATPLRPLSPVPNNIPNSLDAPVCRLGDFWFLMNSRESGCTYSQGRADWGDRSTAPPEARGGFKLSFASDVYAFGLCILTWSKCIDRQEDIDLDTNKESAHLEKKRKAKAAARDIMCGISTTGTSSLPPIEPLRSLGNLLPARWGPNSWLSRLLRMCLQEHPKHRVSSQELLVFLKDVQVELEG